MFLIATINTYHLRETFHIFCLHMRFCVYVVTLLSFYADCAFPSLLVERVHFLSKMLKIFIDQTPRLDLGLHCLLMSQKEDTNKILREQF